MSLTQSVYFESSNVDQRLAELGLERRTFVEAAKENFAAFAACTPNHPPTFPGTAAWAEMNRSIADSLIVVRWGERQIEMNLPLVINESKTMAITASSGDEKTGLKDEFPCTRSAKGPRTAEAVRINQQGSFAFMEDPAQIAVAMKKLGRSTWIFLVYRDMRLGELRYELSRPISISEDGHVNAWAERIVFPSTPFDATASISIDRDDRDGQSPEITVEVKKLG